MEPSRQTSSGWQVGEGEGALDPTAPARPPLLFVVSLLAFVSPLFASSLPTFDFVLTFPHPFDFGPLVWDSDLYSTASPHRHRRTLLSLSFSLSLSPSLPHSHPRSLPLRAHTSLSFIVSITSRFARDLATILSFMLS
ncbi:hypothetical protein JDV02_004165 [Purpureocillium takamizusanense]|uniref:Uncharacterized protein n=1 Tax=Purpureocillium takamizusanense TaxID=2060973 RepID=A0A9Q8QFA8_9HYPO|nr:uncharacterized protein JDV02_004165 [Purpureocillium takamizusanense]UNI17851.1 hypothetical protein JDV02_004165 [Purpureocillium takamizusanense]